MSTAEITIGSTNPAVADPGIQSQAVSSRPAGIAGDMGEVLAQIPDLEPKATPKSSIKRLDGRIISQAFSMKLVFGLGIGLAIGAILPSLFGRGNHASKPVRELPAWNARGSESSNSATAQTQAPPWTPPQAQATVVTPQNPPLGGAMQPPPADEYRPAAMRGPSWSPPSLGSAAPPNPPQATGDVNADYARLGPAPSRPDERAYGPTGDRRELQADNRNDPAARYRGATTYDYRGNPIETPAPSRDGQIPGGPTGYRNDNAADPSGNRPGSPLMPSNNSGAGAYYGNPQDNVPGVAHFENRISAPPAGTN